MTTGWGLSNKMMPAIRAAIGALPASCFFDVQTASAEKDMHEATDLILKLTGGDVAVRVRRYKSRYADGAPLDFDWSVRWHSLGGGKTEIHKLREGYARWYFMAVANEDETGLHDFCLIDLDDVRARGLLNDEKLWQINSNDDGSAGGYMPARTLRDRGCLVWPKK